MVFVSVQDFFEKVKAIKKISREEEIEYAKKMRDGDKNARNAIVIAYLPFAAAAMHHLPEKYQTLELALRCCRAVERAVTLFDFEQEDELFTHKLGWWLKKTIGRYIAEKSENHLM